LPGSSFGWNRNRNTAGTFDPSPTLSLAGGGDVIALFAFITFIFELPAAPSIPEMQFVICAIVVDRDVWFSASDLRIIKRHFGRQIGNMNSIINTSYFCADDHGRR